MRSVKLLALVATFLISAVAGAMPAAVAKSPQIAAIGQALQAHDREKARELILTLLTSNFAKRDAATAAAVSNQLIELDGAQAEWSQTYSVLKGIAEPVIAGTKSTTSENFIHNLATAAGMAKKFDEQDAWIERNLKIVADEAGPDSEASFKARGDAAYSLLNVGRNEEAQRRMLSTLDGMERLKLADLFFDTAVQAGGNFSRLGDHAGAGEIFQRALDSPLMQADTGPGRGFLQFNVAAYLRDLGRYGDAETLGYRALNVLSDHFGMESVEALSAYDGLAQTLHISGKLAAAEASYQFIYATGLKSLGEDSPDLWRIANNRAAVLRSLKLPVEALEFDRFAYDRRYRALGGGANDTVVSAMNMAHDLIDAQRWTDAADVLAAVSRIAAASGFDPVFRQRVERWQVYVQYRLERKHLSPKELAARDTSRWTDNSDIEQTLAFLDLFADRAEENGLLEDAVAYRKHAVETATARFGDAHPMTFDAMLDLVRLEVRVDPGAALDGYRVLDSVMFDWANTSVLLSGSLRAGKAERVLADDMLASLARFATRNREAAELFASALDEWKTLKRKRDRELRQEAETTGDATLHDVIGRYFHAAGRFREIVAATLYTDALSPQREAMDEARKALNAELEKRGEKPVPTLYQSDVEDLEPVKKPDAGDVVVDLAVIAKWPVDRGGEPAAHEVFAVVSRHDAPAEVVAVDTIDLAKDKDKTQAQKRVTAFAAKLTDTLGAVSKGVNALYVIPADFLFQADFAELRLGDGRRLGEVTNVHAATSRQAYEFRGKADRPAKEDGLLLLGGLTSPEAGAFLPGSLMEVQEIAELAKAKSMKTEIVEGREATEPAMRQAASGNAIVHFATHGFYEQDTKLSELLMNTGFVLSDARPTTVTRQTDADNVVYARELLDWDLSASGLVVISACDTAIGDVGLTNAVRGLPLALSVAGARRTLLTLDKVDDQVTMKFMVRFYRNLLDGKLSYADAFIKTKREVWANAVEGVPPGIARAFVLFQH